MNSSIIGVIKLIFTHAVSYPKMLTIAIVANLFLTLTTALLLMLIYSRIGDKEKVPLSFKKILSARSKRIHLRKDVNLLAEHHLVTSLIFRRFAKTLNHLMFFKSNVGGINGN